MHMASEKDKETESCGIRDTVSMACAPCQKSALDGAHHQAFIPVRAWYLHTSVSISTT
jgi:hypothetical protein